MLTLFLHYKHIELKKKLIGNIASTSSVENAVIFFGILDFF